MTEEDVEEYICGQALNDGLYAIAYALLKLRDEMRGVSTALCQIGDIEAGLDRMTDAINQKDDS